MKNYRETPCEQTPPPPKKKQSLKNRGTFSYRGNVDFDAVRFFVYFGSCAIYRTLAINMPIAMTPAKNRGKYNFCDLKQRQL